MPNLTCRVCRLPERAPSTPRDAPSVTRFARARSSRILPLSRGGYWRGLAQPALERGVVEAQAGRGERDVAVAVGEHAADVLPLGALERLRLLVRGLRREVGRDVIVRRVRVDAAEDLLGGDRLEQDDVDAGVHGSDRDLDGEVAAAQG